MQLYLSSAQHTGARSEQQDSFAILHPPDEAFRAHGGLLVVVADGMGGLAHGALASRIAVEQFVKAYREKTAGESIPDALTRCVESANREVHRAAAEKQAAGDMGTTLVAGVFRDSELTWISVGDSGILLFREQAGLAALNTPHTLGAFLARQAANGVVDASMARTHPDREALTSFLGLERIAEIDRGQDPMRLIRGDIVILASDGLFKFLPPESIQEGLRGAASTFSGRLVRKTLETGHPQQDNITVVTVSCGVAARRLSSKAASVAVLSGLFGAGWILKWVLGKRKSSPPGGDEPVTNKP
jgi:protein phosphatase